MISARQKGQPCGAKEEEGVSKKTILFDSVGFNSFPTHLPFRVHLPGSEAGRAQQMTAGLNAYILIVLRADLA